MRNRWDPDKSGRPADTVHDDGVRLEEPALFQELMPRVQSAEARTAGISTMSISAWKQVGQPYQAVKAVGQEVEAKPMSEVVGRMTKSENTSSCCRSNSTPSVKTLRVQTVPWSLCERKCER